MRRYSKWVGVVLALMVNVHALGTDVFATSTVAPEISPGSTSAGLALLAGGVLMLRARRGRK